MATTSNPFFLSIDPTNLTVLNIAPEEDTHIPHLDESLSRFTSLTTLIIGVGMFNREVVGILATLPLLSTLTIQDFWAGEGGIENPYPLNFALCKSLFTGLTAFPALSNLFLPSLPSTSAFSSYHLDENYRPSYEGNTGLVVVNPRWIQPIWPSTCSKEQAKDLLRLAKEKGIKMGSALEEDVLDSERYEDEVVWCAAQPGVDLVDIE